MPDLTQDLVARLCDRHFGIGSDGMIILRESEKHDFRMEYYNSDGKPGTMCGNGGRCITVFAKKSGWIIGDCQFDAADGVHRAAVLPDGSARLELRDVREIHQVPEGYWLDTGSPHLVMFTEELDTLDINALGKKYREDPRFREGTNVNFVQLNSNGIEVRTFERGVEAETLSCGTGVTASAIAAFLHTGKYGSSIPVSTRGGKLKVSFTPLNNHTHFTDIWLTGPVTEVYEGTISL